MLLSAPERELYMFALLRDGIPSELAKWLLCWYCALLGRFTRVETLAVLKKYIITYSTEATNAHGGDIWSYNESLKNNVAWDEYYDAQVVIDEA